MILSTILSYDVLTNNFEFPTNSLKDEIKQTYPTLKVRYESLSRKFLKNTNDWSNNSNRCFNKSETDNAKFKLPEPKIGLQPSAVPWIKGPTKMTPLKSEKKKKKDYRISTFINFEQVA